MPKLRQLKAELRQAGFVERAAKGSHTFWTHPGKPGLAVVLSGHDGDEAKPYQLKQVRRAVDEVQHL